MGYFNIMPRYMQTIIRQIMVSQEVSQHEVSYFDIKFEIFLHLRLLTDS